MKGGLFGLRRWLCHGCGPVPKGRLNLEAIGASGLLVLAGCGVLALNRGLDAFGYFLVVWGGFTLLTPLTLAIHEMGHAGVAALLGRRVYQINIGTGRPFRTFSLGQTRLAFGRELGFGYVVQLPRVKASRWGDMAILAAGPTANLAAAWPLLLLADWVSLRSGGLAALTVGSIFSNVLTGVGALVPKNHGIDGRTLPSDGRQLLQLLRRRPAAVDWRPHHDAYQGVALIQARRWTEAEAHYREAFARHPDQPGLLGALLHVLAISKGHEAARACAEEHDAFLRQEREVPDPMAAAWCYVWGMAAWSLVRSPAGDLASADAFSRRALDVGGVPHPRAIQGAILTRAGEPERGLSEILESLRHLPGPGDKLEFCEFVIAERLESADLKTSDFEAYAAHLRTLA